jgi:HEAT repeat protein
VQDKDWRLRVDAIQALYQIDSARAIAPLIAALEDEHWRVRQGAAQMLGEIGDSRALEPLIAATRDSAKSVRGMASQSLGQIPDPRAVEPLIAVVEKDKGETRLRAIEALREIGDPRAFESLIARLNVQDIDTFRAIARTLADLYRAGVLSEAQKQALLQQRDALTRGESVRAHTDNDEGCSRHWDYGSHIDNHSDFRV